MLRVVCACHVSSWRSPLEQRIVHFFFFGGFSVVDCAVGCLFIPLHWWASYFFKYTRLVRTVFRVNQMQKKMNKMKIKEL